MTGTGTYAAVDLGASSGRVMVGRVGPGRLELTEVHRFPNTPVEVAGTVHWDVLALYREVLDGLRRTGPVDSIAVDSWAVDYGLLDESGALLGNPVHYRDRRTEGVIERVLQTLPAGELYAATGLQLMPINTFFQLAAAAGTPQLASARTLLLMPDLISYWLTGTARAEATNASTTQLFDVRTGAWSPELADRIWLPAGLLPPLQHPGDRVGTLLPAVARATGRGNVPVVAVGSHDTASAVVGVPAAGADFAYISCGTWSLVGVELDAPVLTEASLRANFSNEGGVDGTIRYLHNVMGLWLLQESLRAWTEAGASVDLAALLREAAALPGFAAVVDCDDPAFLPVGDMPARIGAACRRTGQVPPASPAATVRCILDSLALAYRRVLRAAAELSGRDIAVVHLVGGGSRNELLCQLTADACRRPVLAGPVEATALGNVLVQGRAAGVLDGDLAVLRALVRQTTEVRRYEPSGSDAAWDAAERRIA